MRLDRSYWSTWVDRSNSVARVIFKRPGYMGDYAFKCPPPPLSNTRGNAWCHQQGITGRYGPLAWRVLAFRGVFRSENGQTLSLAGTAWSQIATRWSPIRLDSTLATKRSKPNPNPPNSKRADGWFSRLFHYLPVLNLHSKSYIYAQAVDETPVWAGNFDIKLISDPALDKFIRFAFLATIFSSFLD